MKKLLRQGVPYALSLLAACSAQVAQAAPNAGAYVSDARNTWVQDRVGDRIGTVNMIMCIIGSMRGDAMVNQGTYLALIDMKRCEGRGDSSQSSTSASAANAADYWSAAVQSTQASESDPLIIKAWLNEEENGQKKLIHIYLEATAGKTEANPNGLFRMYFCGTDGEPLSACNMRGSLQSTENGLSFFEEGTHNGVTEQTSLFLISDPDADTGSGAIESPEGTFSFAYNPAQFCRDDGTTESCFDRDADFGEYSTWRYGTYNSDGSRLETAHPGFPVKFTYTTTGNAPETKTFYGFWSFWGLWLPEAALANLSQGTLTRRVGEADVPLTTEKHGGKLWKLTRATATLDELKNVPMMFQSPQTVGALQASTQYEVKWNGTVLQAVGTQVCGQEGCHPQPLSSAIDISADDLRNAHQKGMSVFFQGAGGNGMVNVPDTGDFSGSTGVYYRVRDVVKPGDPMLSLDCVSQCLQSGTVLTTALTSNQSPFMGSWGPTGVLHSYTFSGGDLTHDGNGNAQVNASDVDKQQMGNYQWGLNSGAMVSHADVDQIRCDMDGTPNTAGTYYCPNLVEKAAVIYQWETGPNQWNQYFGAVGVTIDAPKMLTLAAHYTSPSDSANTIFGGAAPDYHGNNLQMQFSGFGELQGIPGGCVDPETNQAVPCTQNTRWVPAFNIKDGAALSDGTSTYYVRYLERELRLTAVARNGGSPTMPVINPADMPDASLITINARDQIDGLPTDVPSKPAVIDGTVQDAE